MIRRDQPLPVIAWEHLRRLGDRSDTWHPLLFPGNDGQDPPMTHDQAWSAWAPVVEATSGRGRLVPPPLAWDERRFSVVCEGWVEEVLRWQILPDRPSGRTQIELLSPTSGRAEISVTISHGAEGGWAISQGRAPTTAQYDAFARVARDLGSTSTPWALAILGQKHRC